MKAGDKLRKLAEYLSDQQERYAEINSGYPGVVKLIPGFLIVVTDQACNPVSVDVYTADDAVMWFDDVELERVVKGPGFDIDDALFAYQPESL